MLSIGHLYVLTHMLVLTPDIGECLSSPCDANAMCTELHGSFSCACNSGFSGDGFTCVGKLLSTSTMQTVWVPRTMVMSH